jgi:hypothetical protein
MQGTHIASSAELKNVTTARFTKHYGITAEKCTAHFHTALPDSIHGEYNTTTNACEEQNPNAGLWIVTPRALSQEQIRAAEVRMGIKLIGTSRPDPESRPASGMRPTKAPPQEMVDSKVWLGVGLVISMFLVLAVWRRYPTKPILSLAALIILVTITLSVFPAYKVQN